MNLPKKILFYFILLATLLFTISNLEANPMNEYFKEKIYKAERGDQVAFKKLCSYYRTIGVILFEDKSRVFRLFKKAAQEGDICSQYSLGNMYNYGYSTPVNHKKALMWLEKAAFQGDASAQFEVGLLYQLGKGGIPVNNSKAFKWYKKAASEGNLPAQTTLGDMYYHGQGIPKNYKLALNWHTKAANGDNYFSQFRLGDMYFKGEGIPVDKAEAFKWFKKAAEQKHIHSQLWVGFMYASGDGVRQSNIDAYKWLSIAIAGNDEKISDVANKILDTITPNLTPAEIISSQAKAAEWWKKNPTLF
ncbi:MAG: sel1 repeat family protein [Desulfobacteraceae bacterium]|nr:sel1 repeat family protein [Desulfobacteraceae bacterium]